MADRISGPFALSSAKRKRHAVLMYYLLQALVVSACQ